MPAGRDPPFPMAILCLLLIRGYSSLRTMSGVTGTMSSLGPNGFSAGTPFPSTEDYSQYEDTTIIPILASRVPPTEGTLKRCDYNPCLESQTSCAELAASTGCLCPGFTLHNEAPEAPKLKSVSWNGSEVVVLWCAPNSYVTAYMATVGGRERQKFGKDQRSGGVGAIGQSSEVCVFAVNDAGESNGSCEMYQSSDNGLPLKAGLIGGALGFLLLLSLAVLLWRHKRQRKQQTSYSMRDTAERP